MQNSSGFLRATLDGGLYFEIWEDSLSSTLLISVESMADDDTFLRLILEITATVK